MFVKIIKSCRDVVAACDEEILNQKFEEKEFQLDIKENFYKGESVNEEELIEVLADMKKEDATFNLVGEKTIEASIKARIITKDMIKTIQGIPYSLVLM
jgi:hypothetical protein